MELSGEGGPPVIGLHVGFVAEGGKVHAYSGLKGRWDTLELHDGADPQPIVGTDYVQVRTRESVSLFSARTGKWATVKFANE